MAKKKVKKDKTPKHLNGTHVKIKSFEEIRKTLGDCNCHEDGTRELEGGHIPDIGKIVLIERIEDNHDCDSAVNFKDPSSYSLIDYGDVLWHPDWIEKDSLNALIKNSIKNFPDTCGIEIDGDVLDNYEITFKGDRIEVGCEIITPDKAQIIVDKFSKWLKDIGYKGK